MKILFFANSDWYLFNFRLGLAHHLAASGHDVVMASPPGPHSGKIEAAGFRWYPVPTPRRGADPRRELVSLGELIALYRREKPDLVHHFTLKSILHGSVAARIARVPAVVNAIAGLGYVFTSRSKRARALRLPLKALLRGALAGRKTHVIVQNPDDLDTLVNAGLVPRARVSLIRGSGVDPERFRPRGSTPDSARPGMRVLFCARLLWEKGIGDLVDAARVIRRTRPEILFEVAGDIDEGNPGSVRKEDVDRWQSEGDVNFLGHVGDMRPVYESADVILLPSVYGEGVPRSLIEGAAAGLPIITTNSAGCREAAEDGVNGILVEPHDIDAIVRAVLKLADDRELRLRMGHASRERMLRHFDQRLVFDETVAVYERLLAER